MKKELGLKKIVHYFGLCLTFVVLGNSLWIVWQAYFENARADWLWLVIGGVISIGVFIAIIQISKVLEKNYLGWLLLVLFLLTIPKIIMIFIYPLEPVSDMWSYNVLADLRASGFSWLILLKRGMLDLDLIYPHVLHIGSLFGAFYWVVMKNVLVLQFLNITLTFLDAILLYYIIEFWGGKRAGIIAALLFYLIPNYYIYSGLIGAEPLWLTFVLLSVFFFNKLFRPEYERTTRQYWAFTAAVIASLLVGNLFRPMMLIIAAANFLYAIFSYGNDRASQRYSAKKRIATSAIILGAFLVVSGFQTQLDRLWYQLPVANANVGIDYTIATGQNSDKNGMYNEKIIEQLEKIKEDTTISQAKRFDEMQTYLIQYRDNQFAQRKTFGQWTGFLEAKMKNFATDETWVRLIYQNIKLYPSDEVFIQKKSVKIWDAIITSNQLLFIAASLLALLKRLFWNRHPRLSSHNDNGLFYFEMLYVAIIVFYLIVEIQSRYQVPLYLSVISFVALGFYSKNNSLRKIKEE
ncbi:phospholipid carrier-dependent glycosyltransferase [Enterococcus durans]|uniref:phospholipid carrier-dependent glycosyltransferase n=1 Tax=Enterococcus durans TaxID=53345 RepID=UPI001D0A386C|nr:phospholipid carrier-dependent glycosyltransferase [Enterococcus durans]MCB8505145.1 glycosyltransferase family 39 protein [Enterococcus durans]MCB8514993.1 glycosyltransferase family 39 protein [Enterococcus durans]